MDSQGIVTKSAAVVSAAYLAYVVGQTAWSRKVKGATTEHSKLIGMYSAGAVALVGVIGSGLLTKAIRSLRGQ